jgi:antitoxin MazE
MLTKIQKWGNSQGLRLARNLLADAQLEVGDEVDISVKDGVMIVAPAKRIRGKHSLKNLVARIPENYQTVEVDWGEPVGKEAW